MKTPTASSATSSQREQTSLLSQMPRSPRSNVCSTRDLENPSVSVHPKRFSTPSLTLKFLCAGKLNPRDDKKRYRRLVRLAFEKLATMYSSKRSYLMGRWSCDNHRNHRRRTHWQPDRTTRSGKRLQCGDQQFARAGDVVCAHRGAR